MVVKYGLKRVNLADGVRKYLGRGPRPDPTGPISTEKVWRRRRVSRVKT
jgi:hypothetical protein